MPTMQQVDAIMTGYFPGFVIIAGCRIVLANLPRPGSEWYSDPTMSGVRNFVSGTCTFIAAGYSITALRRTTNAIFSDWTTTRSVISNVIYHLGMGILIVGASTLNS